MKIFYTAYEGAYIYQKTLPFGIGFKRLLKRLESLPAFPKDWKYILGTRMHSIFVPCGMGLVPKDKYVENPKPGQVIPARRDLLYQRWDAINGYTEITPYDNLADLKRCAKSNKKQKRRKRK